MSALQKILVLVDFSEDSANDLKYAVSLAQETETELVVLYVTQKKHANNFYALLAVVEGAPMLNRPARIPVDRLLSVKALDLYHFIEKVVRDPERLTIRRKVVLGNKAETILRSKKRTSIWACLGTLAAAGLEIHRTALGNCVYSDRREYIH